MQYLPLWGFPTAAVVLERCFGAAADTTARTAAFSELGGGLFCPLRSSTVADGEQQGFRCIGERFAGHTNCVACVDVRNDGLPHHELVVNNASG